MRGDLAAANEVFETAIEAARVNGNQQGLAWNLFGRSIAADMAGDTATALSTARESIDTLRGMERSFPTTGAGHALAAALLAAGDAAGAEEVLLDTCGGEQLSHAPGTWRAGGLELLTRCRLARGDVEGADRSAANARAWAVELGLSSAAAMADRAAAAVALAR